MSSLLDTLAGVAPPPPPQSVVVTPTVPTLASASPVEVIPYNALADPDSDKFLPWCWQRLQQDDLVDLYFPGEKSTGFAMLVRLFSGDGNVALFKATDESLGSTWDARIPGFTTWTHTRMGASDVLIAGVIFFRRWWGHRTTDEAARAAFKFWFSQEPRIDIILGVCPSLHKAVDAYNKRVGFRETGRITGAHLYKGRKCDAVLYEITRDQWEALCQ